VTVRTCVGRHAACRRRLFPERWPDLAAPSARKAQRLVAALRARGLARGGQAGARVAARRRVATRPSPRLRLVHTAPVPGPATLQAVGGDEGAWRRGHRDGTILVQLSDQRVVDLVPDRAAAAVAAWLTAQPTIPGSRRERRALDAAGLRQGAPQASQVVDRVHRVATRRAAVEACRGTPRPALLAAAVRPAPARAAVAAPVPVTAMDSRHTPLDSGPPAAPRGGAAAAAGPVGRTRGHPPRAVGAGDAGGDDRAATRWQPSHGVGRSAARHRTSTAEPPAVWAGLAAVPPVWAPALAGRPHGPPAALAGDPGPGRSPRRPDGLARDHHAAACRRRGPGP